MADTIPARLASLDWKAAYENLDARGYAVLDAVLRREECVALTEAFEEERFRKHIAMAEHGYGLGDYKYFRYPLPDLVQTLREAAYPFLIECVNRWAIALGRDRPYPSSLSAFLEECHRAGQTRPTPLILRYHTGGYNRLHQDRYGDVHFPLQLAVLLSEPGADFTGGELILTEQRARMQARAHVVRWTQGDAVLFAVHERPVLGARGPVRTRMRHGVSELYSGERFTLGVIFHDAA